MVALRIELSTTRLSAVSGQPALDYHFVQVGHPGVEPRPCRRGDRAPICTSARSSVRTAGFEPRAPIGTDAGLVGPGPRPGAITRLRHVLKKASFSASSILTRRWPSHRRLLDSTRSAHGRVKPFTVFTPVVGVSTAQQQAVVQRVFWDWFEHPVGYSHLTRPTFCSGKRSAGPLSGSSNAFRRPL